MCLTYRRISADQWNDKITTLPGLYLLSAVGFAPVARSLGMGAACSTPFLRTVNLMLAAGVPIMSALCRQQVL